MDVRVSPSRHTETPLVAPRFKYLADPVCVCAVLAYALNRFWWKQTFSAALPFLRGHLDDCLLIPAALPVLLWIFKQTGLRKSDAPPSLLEVLYWAAVWSVVFEGIFPMAFQRGVQDWRDVGSYLGGGLLAWLFWHSRAPKPTAVTRPREDSVSIRPQ
jgi:hypothetical protein